MFVRIFLEIVFSCMFYFYAEFCDSSKRVLVDEVLGGGDGLGSHGTTVGGSRSHDDR